VAGAIFDRDGSDKAESVIGIPTALTGDITTGLIGNRFS
jgi:hypothetical protein